MSSHQEYIDRLRKQLEEWDYELDRLEHRVRDLADQARERAKKQLESARGYRQDVEKKLERLEDSANHALEDLRDGLEIAWDGIKTGYYAARAEFEDDKDREKQE